MAATGNFREQWLGLGTELVVRATRSICAGSLLNADSGRAVTAARIEEWAGVLSLYEPQLSLVEPQNESVAVRATA
ncbi:hypothetical protein F1D05_31820 [Kribbella qitaiheensis]|uniref:Uncharacterized protein n=1 Tax=Kribbella qitaiheensis TaxID=1544730 RepID=A0A7G6X607_9ACTN|nr:hypothetical protein [Kribbella qitaiheensis]QNE21672.1 hypothetical protein F1D05_31820 [Kribbella qitaiheensis]